MQPTPHATASAAAQRKPRRSLARSAAQRMPLLPTLLVAAMAVASAYTPVAFAQTAPQGPAASMREPMANGFIVKYKQGAKSGAEIKAAMQGLRALVQANGFEIALERRMATGARVMKLPRRVPARALAAMVEHMRQYDAAIEYVQPNYIDTLNFTPNDTSFDQQWALIDPVSGVNAQAAWDFSKGTDVRIAIVDTGVLPHADLVANLLPGYDFIEDSDRANDGDGRDSDASDPGNWVETGGCGGMPYTPSVWHGTHVAGIAAGRGNNGTGISGVAPQAKIVPVRALGRCGGDLADVIDGWMWAAGFDVDGVPANANPARIINYSAGGKRSCTSAEQDAINRIRYTKGATMVVAAGNRNLDVSTQAPANCSEVIAVGATGKTGAKAAYSNYGDGITVSAPGGDSALWTQTDPNVAILSTYNYGSKVPSSDTLEQLEGTSMAAPHVAGVMALMAASNVKVLDGAVAPTLLKESTRPFASTWAGGAGLIDANMAVQAARAYRAEVEPNDTTATAQLILNSPSDHWSMLQSTSDVDYFLTSVQASSSLKIELINQGIADLRITLLDRYGKVVSIQNRSGAKANETLIRTNSLNTAEPIYVKVDAVPGTPVGMFGSLYRLKLTRGPLLPTGGR